jgi:hypothetical protein
MRIRFNRKGCLYRHWDKNGRLLYIGESVSIMARLAGHRSTAHWFEDIANVTFEWFPDKRSAVEAEAAAIVAEQPLHNVAHKKKAARAADDSDDPPVPLFRGRWDYAKKA